MIVSLGMVFEHYLNKEDSRDYIQSDNQYMKSPAQ